MNIKKIIMLILVCFGPLSLFYFLSRGEYYFTKLPMLHDSKEGKPESYKSFQFTDQDGKIYTQDSLKNKLIIVSYMDKACPYKCKVDGKALRLVVYKEIIGAPGFKDVIMLTEVNDSTTEGRKNIEKSLEVDGNRWKFIYSKDFSFFDASINKMNPYTTMDTLYKDGTNTYQRSILLLDKDLRIRGFIDASRRIEFKRLNEELRLLKKEYAKKKTVI